MLTMDRRLLNAGWWSLNADDGSSLVECWLVVAEC